MNEVYAVVEPEGYEETHTPSKWGAELYLQTPRAIVSVAIEALKPLDEHTPEEAAALKRDFEYMLFQLSDLYESFR